MDSEMVLPTAMTIFNRSTINLENETQVISSYRIVEETVNDLSSNISYYSIGNIKKSQDHHTEWLGGLKYTLQLNMDVKEISEVKLHKLYFSKEG